MAPSLLLILFAFTSLTFFERGTASERLPLHSTAFVALGLGLLVWFTAAVVLGLWRGRSWAVAVAGLGVVLLSGAAWLDAIRLNRFQASYSLDDVVVLLMSPVLFVTFGGTALGILRRRIAAARSTERSSDEDEAEWWEGWGEDVPWMQVGPAPTHLWAWDDPDFREQLEVGMILFTYDCAYLGVREIRDDGIVDTGGTFRTWGQLKRLEATIEEERMESPPSSPSQGND